MATCLFKKNIKKDSWCSYNHRVLMFVLYEKVELILSSLVNKEKAKPPLGDFKKHV